MTPSGPMIEVIALPDLDGLRLVAAHEAEPDRPWYVLVAPADRDSWLSIIEIQDPNDLAVVRFDPGDATFYEKLAILFGDPWERVWESFEQTMDEQMQTAEALGPRMRAKIEATPAEELIDYRTALEAEPVQRGEILRQELLGIQVLQGRN